MANLNGFNAADYQERSFDALPVGWYTVAIVDSESKSNKAGNGTYLHLTLEVLAGEHKGRKLFDRLNLDNPNAQAVEIARSTLAAICRAVNVLTPRDSSELHGKPLRAKVSVREYNGDHQNEVKGYKSASDTSAGSKPKAGGEKQMGKSRWKPNRLKRDEAPANVATESDDENGNDAEGAA